VTSRVEHLADAQHHVEQVCVVGVEHDKLQITGTRANKKRSKHKNIVVAERELHASHTQLLKGLANARGC
jgi:hypothetical protein